MARQKVPHQSQIKSYNYDIDIDSDYEDVEKDSENDDLDVDSETETVGKNLYNYILIYIQHKAFDMKN